MAELDLRKREESIIGSRKFVFLEGPVSPRNGQITRVLTIAHILQESRCGLTVKEIKRAINHDHPVGIRTIYRDLEALKTAGFPLEEIPGESSGLEEGNGTRFRMRRNESGVR